MNHFINQSDNTIEDILKYSVTLFNDSGLEDLAKKWDIILSNYQKIKIEKN